MKCPKCNADVRQDAKFCDNCGYELHKKNICPYCGKKLAADAKFCDGCGKSLTGKSEQSKFGKTEKLIVAAIACVVVILIVAVAIWLHGRTDEHGSTLESAAESAVESAASETEMATTTTPEQETAAAETETPEQETAAVETEEPEQETAAAQTETPAEETEKAASNDKRDALGTVSYPIDQGKTCELSTMCPKSFESTLTDVFSYVEEKTGITIKIDLTADETYSELYKLMVASGDFVDIVLCDRYDEDAYEDGVYLDVFPYLEECAPDFLRLCADAELNLPSEFYDSHGNFFFATVDNEGAPIGGYYEDYGVGIYITTACEHVEEAVEWANYLYADQNTCDMGSMIGKSTVDSNDLNYLLSNFILSDGPEDNADANALLVSQSTEKKCFINNLNVIAGPAAEPDWLGKKTI